MKLAIYSDLHTEFKPFDYPLLDADILILAGDIHLGLKGIHSTLHLAEHYAHVLYIFGNHEYYDHRYPDLMLEAMHKLELPQNYHVMENSLEHISGVRFFGATLWTDFDLQEDPEKAMRYAERHMNDYRIIYNSEEFRPLSPDDTQEAHLDSKSTLNFLLSDPHDGPTVVITHHAPHPNSLNHDRGNDPRLDPAYASDLSALITQHTPELWIHGHTHKCEDYKVGPTRIISNQRGYIPHQPVHDFNPNLIIEI